MNISKWVVKTAFKRLCCYALVALFYPLSTSLAIAQNIDLPDGFSETVIATDIEIPVGMEVSPDGRLFVLAGRQKRIEIFDDSGYLNEFIRLPQALNKGSGLLGLEFATDFESSGDVYIAYITDPDDLAGPQRYRISRFSSNGTTANRNSEEVIFEVNDVESSQQLHQGGDLVIGDDGKIYWALGDRVHRPFISQPLNSLFGKLLRLNIDGTIPTDNPFYASLSGDLRAIYANGLRNPYRMDKRTSTGEIFMSDVGTQDWEELNQAEPGANYGWPLETGVVNKPGYTDPALAYHHQPDGCAITGGSFYEPLVNQFPDAYHDKFFYGDHCFGWIAYHDLDNGNDIRFMTGAHRLVEVKVSPVTGAIYYLDREYAGDTSRSSGGIGRIDYVGGTVPLNISRHPSSVTASVGADVAFDVLVSGESPFTFQWFQNDDELEGETQSTLTIDNVQAGDNGHEFFVRIVDANGASETSEIATLTVVANNAPNPVITAPGADALFVAGDEYSFAGSASDEEDGELDESAFNWEIVFHHDDHTHPFIQEITNVKDGTFIPSPNSEIDPNVWYRIHLTVTDSAGASSTVYQDIFPVHTDVRVETVPEGLELVIDGASQSAPIEFEGVAGVARLLEAPQSQVIDGETWTFSSWSNGGARSQTISTPIIDTTYTASYVRDRFNDTALEITRQPSSIVAAAGDGVSFDVLVTGEPPITFQWFRNDIPIDGETGSSLVLNNVQSGDSEFYVQIRDANDSIEQSDTVTLTISSNAAPIPIITEPSPGLLYVAGQEYPFAGIATDTEDGELDASALEWEIVFHHNDHHTHVLVPETSGITNGTFVPPISERSAPPVWYRIRLTATDSAGTSTSTEQDVFPLISDIAVDTFPAGLEVFVDDTARGAPVAFEAVAGVERVLEAPEIQLVNGQVWTFSSWSNGGERRQIISTPLVDTTYTASYALDTVEENLPLVAGLSSPVAGSIAAAPVTIGGVATDALGVRRVQIVIQELGTKNYWNGSNFASGWRSIDAELDTPNNTTTPWSYTFSPSTDVEVRVVAKARSTNGVSGDKERVEFSVTTDSMPPSPTEPPTNPTEPPTNPTEPPTNPTEPPTDPTEPPTDPTEPPTDPTEPSIEISSPNASTGVNNPVRIVGTAHLAELSTVKLVVKQKGARNYWNGNDWQSGRIEINASLTDENWTYDLDQPNPRDVVVRAIAIDANGTRLFSDRVTLFID